MTEQKTQHEPGVIKAAVGILIFTTVVFWVILFVYNIHLSLLWAIGFLFLYPIIGRALVFCAYRLFVSYRKNGGKDEPRKFTSHYHEFILLGSVTAIATFFIVVYWAIANFLNTIANHPAGDK